MGKQFLEQPVVVGGGWNREIPGQTEIGHTAGFFCSKYCFFELKQEKRGNNLRITGIVVYEQSTKIPKQINKANVWCKRQTQKLCKSFLA